MTFTFQPDRIIKWDPEHVQQNTNKNFQRIFTAHQNLDGTAIKGPLLGLGFAVNAGNQTITGSMTGIVTGLAMVDHVIVSIDNGATATNFWVTGTKTPTNVSTIDIYCWQPTSSGNNTPIASTTPTVVRWWVTGTSSGS